MKCVFGLFPLCVVQLWSFGSCSIVEFNDSALIPPLYGTDGHWPCRPIAGNGSIIIQYVTYELFSNGSSATLDYLKEYSKQSLKHYNRSLVHRVECPFVKYDINIALKEYKLQGNPIRSFTLPLATEMGQSGRAFIITCVILVVLTLLATSIHVLSERSQRKVNKFPLAFSLKQNWQILTYDRSKPRSEDRMKDLACLEGIRVLGMEGVIFSHVIFIYVYSYIDNPEFVEHMYDSLFWKYVLNSPLWLQAFFSMSGFLTAYTVLITCDTKPMTLLRSLMAILNRYVRLTPVALMALWFTISVFPVMGSGPHWMWLVQRESFECTDRWMYHALYTHNHLELGKMCMGHTWYLAADMQLHVLGIVLLLVFVRWRTLVLPVLAGLLGASCLAAGILTYLYQLTPIIGAQAPEALRNLFAEEGRDTMSLLYLPSYMNLPGYVCGMATAFLLHHCQQKGEKLNEKKWFNLLFHLSLPLGACVVVAGAAFLADAPRAAAAPLYAAVDRTLVAVCVNIFMLGCFSSCRSALGKILYWRGFHSLGRLSYSVFIIHFIVLRLTLASNTQLGHASAVSMLSLFITASLLSFAAAVPVCLLVELPFVQLWKAMTEWGKERATGDIEPERDAQRGVNEKGLDLVARC